MLNARMFRGRNEEESGILHSRSDLSRLGLKKSSPCSCSAFLRPQRRAPFPKSLLVHPIVRTLARRSDA